VSEHVSLDFSYQPIRTNQDNIMEGMEEDEQLQLANAGGSTTYPLQCSYLRKGGHVMIKGRPCKIVEMSTSKTGKHGHAKVKMVALDIFDGTKKEDLCPSTHNMEVPIVTRSDFQVLSIDEGYVTLMNDKGEQKEDLTVPEDSVGEELMKHYEDSQKNVEMILTVTVLCCKEVETEKIIAVKTQGA